MTLFNSPLHDYYDWNTDTTYEVKKFSDTVNKTDKKTKQLKFKINNLEDKVNYIETKGTLFHTDCPHSKRFFGCEPQRTIANTSFFVEIRELNGKLTRAHKHIIKLRNLSSELQNNLKHAQRMLISEIGHNIDLNSPTLKLKYFGGWKGRAQKIISLQHQLKELRNRFTNAGNIHSSLKKCTPNRFISKEQREIMKIQSNNALQLAQQENEVNELKCQIKELTTAWEAIEVRNNTLSRQLRDTKDKLKNNMNKSSEDKKLIRSLMHHQKILQDIIDKELFVMKEEFVRNQEFIDFLSSDFEKENKDEKNNNNYSNKISYESYKTLLFASENKAKTLENATNTLYKRLEMVVLQVIEAEKHCCDHELKIENMNAQFEELKKSGVVNIRIPSLFSGKETKEHLTSMTAKEQLKTKDKENRLLRKFLKDTLKSKSDDFTIYKVNLEIAKKEYLKSLAKIKKKFTTQNKEKEDEEADDEE